MSAPPPSHSPQLLPELERRQGRAQGVITRAPILVVMVTGGRSYKGAAELYGALDVIHRERGIKRVIVGDCETGADPMAWRWAIERKVPVTRYRANWEEYGNAAGPIRNGRMVEEGKPDMVLAAPGGKGTADAVRQARARSVPIFELGHFAGR